MRGTTWSCELSKCSLWTDLTLTIVVQKFTELQEKIGISYWISTQLLLERVSIPKPQSVSIFHHKIWSHCVHTFPWTNLRNWNLFFFFSFIILRIQRTFLLPQAAFFTLLSAQCKWTNMHNLTKLCRGNGISRTCNFKLVTHLHCLALYKHQAHFLL